MVLCAVPFFFAVAFLAAAHLILIEGLWIDFYVLRSPARV